MSVSWNYYDKYDGVIEQYMPLCGEGETMASQIVTAVNKLVYKWYNDGDVFDNSYGMKGWWNDLSSFANWLDTHTNASHILAKIEQCFTRDDYESLLKELADELLDEEFLFKQNAIDKSGSIYHCDGRYEFVWMNDDQDDECDSTWVLVSDSAELQAEYSFVNK